MNDTEQRADGMRMHGAPPHEAAAPRAHDGDERAEPVRPASPALTAAVQRYEERSRRRWIDDMRDHLGGRLVQLHKALGAGGAEAALGVRSIPFWRFGEWLRGLERAAIAQQTIGNLTANDGAGGGERCGLLTTAQCRVAQAQALLTALPDIIDVLPDGDVVEISVSMPTGEVQVVQVTARERSRCNNVQA